MTVRSTVHAREPEVRAPGSTDLTKASVRVGAVAATAALVALGSLAVDGRNRLVELVDLQNAYGVGFTVYSVDHFVLAGVLLCAGVGLMGSRAPATSATLAAISGLCAAQLAGLGMVAYRKWPSFGGAIGTITDWGLVQTLAAVMSASCAIAAVTSLVLVLRLRSDDDRTLQVTAPLGLVVVVLLPILELQHGPDAADRIAVVLQYGLPLGTALALTGVMPPRPAVAVAAAVAASAFLMTLSRAFVDAPPGPAIAVVVGCALAAGGAALVRP